MAWLLSQTLTKDSLSRHLSPSLTLSLCSSLSLTLPYPIFHSLTPCTSAQLPPGALGGGSKYLGWESRP